MGNTGIKKPGIIGILVAITFIIGVITAFPIIRFNGKAILLFAPDRLTQQADFFHANILGSHVLETKHGEIRLARFSEVMIVNGLARIDTREFKAGRASHNLVIEGIEIPPNVSIAFNNSDEVSILVLDGQEINVSDIPLAVERMVKNPSRHPDSIAIGVIRAPEYIHIPLSDSTHLTVGQFRGSLIIFTDGESWELERRSTGFLVKRPGETEYTRYRSITFGANWGEFIEGELFE